MECKHTATPWKAYKARTLIHIGPDGHPVVSISVSPPRIPERDLREQMVAQAEADAEFIVRACNAHDRLVAVAKAYLEVLEAGHLPEPHVRSVTLATVGRILTEAEGK